LYIGHLDELGFFINDSEGELDHDICTLSFSFFFFLFSFFFFLFSFFFFLFSFFFLLF